jgi:hypothetical protein
MHGLRVGSLKPAQGRHTRAAWHSVRNGFALRITSRVIRGLSTAASDEIDIDAFLEDKEAVAVLRCADVCWLACMMPAMLLQRTECPVIQHQWRATELYSLHVLCQSPAGLSCGGRWQLRLKSPQPQPAHPTPPLNQLPRNQGTQNLSMKQVSL